MIVKPRVRTLLPYIVVVLLALFVHGPALRVPFAVDDYAHEAMLDRSWPLRRAPWDLFNFVDGSRAEVRALTDAGLLPWWSHDELAFRFFRPLTSLTRALDHAAFGSSPLAAHAHSFLWWIACCAGVALLFHRTLGARVAPVALAFFALDDSHTLPLGWLANRSFLVATAFGAFALAQWDRYRTAGHKRDALSASLLFSLSLLGGEFAFTTIAYALAHTLVARGQLVSRARSTLVWLAPALLYLLIYRVGGFGSRHSDAYLDPIQRTTSFLLEAPSRWFGHVGDLWFSVPADGPSPLRWSPLRARLTGAALLSAIAAALYAMRPVPLALRWLALGSALALVPVLPSFGATRLQMGAQIGVAAVMGVLVVRVLEALARKDEPARARRAAWMAAIPALSLVLLHLGLGSYNARFRAGDMRAGHERELRMIQRARVRREGLADARVVLVAAVDGQTLLYTPWIWRRAGLALPRSWLGMTGTPGLYRLSRSEPDVLVLEAFAGPYLLDRPEMMFRARESLLREGARVELAHVTITIEQLRTVRRVSFRFHASIDQAFRLLVMDAQGMREIPLPPVGGAMMVPAAEVPASPL
ncbi:MAG: hypothetical protein U0269_19130 [Polyangiales bacterium]